MEELPDCIPFPIFNDPPKTYTDTLKGLSQVISYQSIFLFTNPFTCVYAFSMAIPSDYTSFQNLTLESSFILEPIHLSTQSLTRNHPPRAIPFLVDMKLPDTCIDLLGTCVCGSLQVLSSPRHQCHKEFRA